VDLISKFALFFDRFGIAIFTFIALEAFLSLYRPPWQTKWKLVKNNAYPSKLRFYAWIRLAIGILGFLVDGGLVLTQDLLLSII
jgi:hypothetical protein